MELKNSVVESAHEVEDFNNNPEIFNISNNVVKHKFQSLLIQAKAGYHNTAVHEKKYQAEKEELKRQEWKELTDKESLDRQESALRSESSTVEEYVRKKIKETQLEKEKLRETISKSKALRTVKFDAVKINRKVYACLGKKEFNDFKSDFESKCESKCEAKKH